VNGPTLGWTGVLRLGLVQACLGAIVVLTTSTLNRVMVVELSLPALLPGLLVALHYMVQVVRPRMGFGSDVGGRRTPWIVGGLALLALGGIGAAVATVWMAESRVAGLVLGVCAFVLIGVGVSAAGTSLLVLLAKCVPADRRAPAATMVWMMMIVGFAVTAGLAGRFLDPYSPQRLLTVTVVVAVAAVLLALVALRGVEPGALGGEDPAVARGPAPRFREALAEVWQETAARRFTVFIFVSMLAYSAQDLILEPFAGAVFGFTPGQSTSLAGLQHAGVLAGMILVAAAAGPWARGRLGTLRGWAVGGCLGSALALAGLAVAGGVGPGWPLLANVFLLGAANGAFSIAAIGSMMSLAGEGRVRREGVRMGLWGAAQAVAFGAGGLIGTGASDLAHALTDASGAAYAAVFTLEALLFVLSAVLAAAAVGRGAARVRPADATGRSMDLADPPRVAVEPR
jgi:BCD family chlorophyll transporter-like MFS transporter